MDGLSSADRDEDDAGLGIEGAVSLDGDNQCEINLNPVHEPVPGDRSRSGCPSMPLAGVSAARHARSSAPFVLVP
jgi:hypothetical protein